MNRPTLYMLFNFYKVVVYVFADKHALNRSLAVLNVTFCADFLYQVRGFAALKTVYLERERT